MSDLYPELPGELEEQWCEALAGGDVSAALQKWLSSHPAAAQELMAMRDVAAQLTNSRDAMDPGAHYFESMTQEVVAQLEAPRLVGARVVTEPEESAASWARVRDWFVRRPSLGWALVMAAALMAILAWPQAPPHTPTAPVTTTQPTSPDSNDWLRTAVPSTFSEDELLALRRVAASMDIDPMREDTGDEDWGFGLGAGAVEAMGAEELERASKSLEAPL